MSESYYGRPIVKPHVWTPFIPWYFWIGGMSGAAAVHAAVARLRGDERLATVQSRAALAGVTIAPILLIADLGVPARFLHMLRVFKVTSPMSVGTWILLAFSIAIGTSNAADFLGRKRVARGSELLAAGLGPLLATYTAVLIADTATPVWHAAYRTLPFLFISSGIAAAGAVGCAFGPAQESAPARRMMVGGALALVGVGQIMERQIGSLLAEPYRTGKAATLKRFSAAFGLAGAVIGVLGRKNHTWTRVAATAVATAGVLERFTVLQAGTQSALDPKFVVEPQRARLAQNGNIPASIRS